jgi:hypothetical protein
MERKMFGHRLKKFNNNARTPGEPINDQQYDQGSEQEESFGYVKSHDSPNRTIKNREGMNKDAPPGYEGKEHVKYRDPGQTRHHIKFPEDEPHMKSHVDSNETHEAEDDYHMGVPSQTKYDLESSLKRAHMRMDADLDEPNDHEKIFGNPTYNVGKEGKEDFDGQEEEGPEDMQKAPKEHRKKMIAAVMRRKMKTRKSAYQGNA